MQQHLGRQAGVQKVEVSLLDGKVQITPKDDGQIDPDELMKATYDSGVTVAEMDVIARGTITKDSAGVLTLQVEPNRSFEIVPNDRSHGLEPLAGTGSRVTVHGVLFEKPPGKKKQKPPKPLKLTVLEIQEKE
ncbi:MAG TPA: hypothetical protein VJP87_03745 [Candidatus Acidoferrales bacterium]|nr:hypothetical protein [Candidatus Acidoferrales bacterium]